MLLASAQQPGGQFRVTAVQSSYLAAPLDLSGALRTGLMPDRMLSGIGFNQSGGPLLFNHPRSLASDGKRLLLSDGNNNRVLIWLSLPDANTPPDIVLGQPDFESNDPGAGLHQMNWPGQISITPEGIVAVADTFNDRLLLWREFPSQTGQAADLEIRHSDLRWPWGVWTDGKRLAASATGGRAILFWRELPRSSTQPPDFQIRGSGIGTPRTITSDGARLMVGDHNGFETRIGNFVWNTFPQSAASNPDFFLTDPEDANSGWMHGSFTSEGKFVALGGRSVFLYDEFPQSAEARPNLALRGYPFRGGDGGMALIAGGRLYVLEYNGNKILAFRGMPSDPNQRPEFAIGSPSVDANTLLTGFFITNPAPVSHGRSLFVTSDFDRRMSVWKQLPDDSGAHPDWVYELPFAPWDNALHRDTLAIAGQREVAIWRPVPLAGQLPDVHFRGGIGAATFEELRGIALDDKYFYLADHRTGAIHVWAGIPSQTDAPLFTLQLPGVSRLSSDGQYLVATVPERQSVVIYAVASLGEGATGQSVGGPGMFNLPQGASIHNGRLFVASTNFNLVMMWNDVAGAIARRPADVILGAPNNAGRAAIGQASLFWPGVPCFDGSYLWLGEFKFSHRLLRYRVE